MPDSFRLSVLVLFLYFIPFLFTPAAKAQTYISKSFYGDSLDLPVFADTNSAGGVTLVNTRNVAYSGIISVIQTDSMFNINWNYTFYGQSERFREVSAISLNDGSLLIFGRVLHDTSSSIIPFIMKVNSSGQQEWYKKYTIPGEIQFRTATEIPGHGIILGSRNSCLVKIDFSGSVIWCKSFFIGIGIFDSRKIIVNHGDSTFTVLFNDKTSYTSVSTARFDSQGDFISGSYSSFYFNNGGINIRSVVPGYHNNDTLFVISGHAANNLGGLGLNAFGIMIIDLDGTIIYARSFNVGIVYLQGQVVVYNQNIYAVAANNTGLISVLKFDLSGNLLDKYYFQSDCFNIRSLAVTDNGTILVAGTTSDGLGTNLVKFDLNSPTTSCSYPNIFSPGSNVIPFTTVAVSGASQPKSHSYPGALIYPLAYNYNEVVSCQSLTSINDLLINPHCFTISSINSSTLPIMIRMGCEFNSQAHFDVFDVSGKLMLRHKAAHKAFEFIHHRLAAGVYSYRIVFDGRFETGKFIIN